MINLDLFSDFFLCKIGSATFVKRSTLKLKPLRLVSTNTKLILVTIALCFFSKNCSFGRTYVVILVVEEYLIVFFLFFRLLPCYT